MTEAFQDWRWHHWSKDYLNLLYLGDTGNIRMCAIGNEVTLSRADARRMAEKLMHYAEHGPDNPPPWTKEEREAHMRALWEKHEANRASRVMPEKV